MESREEVEKLVAILRNLGEEEKKQLLCIAGELLQKEEREMTQE